MNSTLMEEPLQPEDYIPFEERQFEAAPTPFYFPQQSEYQYFDSNTFINPQCLQYQDYNSSWYCSYDTSNQQPQVLLSLSGEAFSTSDQTAGELPPTSAEFAEMKKKLEALQTIVEEQQQAQVQHEVFETRVEQSLKILTMMHEELHMLYNSHEKLKGDVKAVELKVETLDGDMSQMLGLISMDSSE